MPQLLVQHPKRSVSLKFTLSSLSSDSCRVIHSRQQKSLFRVHIFCNIVNVKTAMVQEPCPGGHLIKRAQTPPDLPIRGFVTCAPSEARIHSGERPDPEVIKNFMLNSAEHEIFPAHKC